jgi:hypothetical protein
MLGQSTGCSSGAWPVLAITIPPPLSTWVARGERILIWPETVFGLDLRDAGHGKPGIAAQHVSNRDMRCERNVNDLMN